VGEADAAVTQRDSEWVEITNQHKECKLPEEVPDMMRI